MFADFYKAAREVVAVVQLDILGLIKLTGSDRVSWLQGMVTNDVQKPKTGAGCYAAHLTPQGKIVARMTVLKDDDALWLCLERNAIPNLIAAFDKLLIMEDVQVSDVTAEYSILGLMGPQAAAALGSWVREPISLQDLYSHRIFGDRRVVASQLGYDVWVPRAQAESAIQSLSELGVKVVDFATWNVLRTEVGIPIFGIDVDETTTMPELGEAGISYDKGCYIGQEVVAKVKYIGHVNRRFVGMVVSGSDLPEAKSAIRKSGKDVGYVTSAVFSPTLNKPIALGFVSRLAGTPGSEVEVGTGAATIVDLPFR